MQLGALCRKPSINAASCAPVSSAAAPVLLLAEERGAGEQSSCAPTSSGLPAGSQTPTESRRAAASSAAQWLRAECVCPLPAPQALPQPKGCVMRTAAGSGDPCVARMAARQHRAHPASEDHANPVAGRGIGKTCWVTVLRGLGCSTVAWEGAIVLQQSLMLLRAREQRAAREPRGAESRGL